MSNNRINELLNRKPEKWSRLSVKTFNQDISLLQSTVKEQRVLINKINDISRMEHLTLGDFAIEVLRIIEKPKIPTRKPRV